jgi:PKHD-type hydroxylase
MLLTIPAVLSAEQLRHVQELLATAPFVNGKLSAGKQAARVKHNLELASSADKLAAQLNTIVMGSLVQHPVYQYAALPLRVAAPYYARYSPGMQYGRHIDDPIMGTGDHYRSDISISIFLNAPDTYQGGELVIHTAFGKQHIKLPAGDAVMYPASSLHEVSPITDGERLVAVTWVQSLVRDPAQRELLYELYQARETLLRDRPDAAETAQVSNAYVNLLRMWSEI